MRDIEPKHERINRLLHFNFIVSLAALLFLNLADAFFTIIFVDTLGLQEANPIVAPLFIWGPGTFLTWKLLTVAACCGIIYVSWIKNRKAWVQKFVNILLVVYGILVLTHTVIFIKLLLM
jgi:hypothetical protein